MIVGLQILQVHIGDQDQLLAEIVKGDHLVEEHQVAVLKLLGIPGVQTERRLGVLQIVVGEVAHEPAGERRETCHAGAAVL